MPLGKDSVLLTLGELLVPRIQIRPEVLGESGLLLLLSRLIQQIYPISVPKSCLETLHTKPPAPPWLCGMVMCSCFTSCPSLQLSGTGALFSPFSCIFNQGSAVPGLHKDTLKFKELPQILSLFNKKPEFRQTSEGLANCAGLFLPLYSQFPLTSPLAKVLAHCPGSSLCFPHHSCFCEAPTPLPWGLLPSS